MTLLLRDRDVRALASFPEAVEVVARAVMSPGVAERSTMRFDHGWLRVMSGTLPSEDVLGFKAFHLVPAGVRYLISLYRLSDGEPLAMIDGNHITSMRTSAAAAAAAARFFGDQPVRVGIIGSGRLARDGLRALASVCQVTAARVYSRTAANRMSYASELGQELGIDLLPAASPEDATSGADHVLCATLTGGEVALKHADAGPARFISSVSSTLPAQRELDEQIIAAAGLVVLDTADALDESGDLLAAVRAGFDRNRVAMLSSYLSDGPGAADPPVVYKSIGSVEQDLALAVAVWSRAERQGMGDRIEPVQSRHA